MESYSEDRNLRNPSHNPTTLTPRAKKFSWVKRLMNNNVSEPSHPSNRTQLLDQPLTGAPKFNTLQKPTATGSTLDHQNNNNNIHGYKQKNKNHRHQHMGDIERREDGYRRKLHRSISTSSAATNNKKFLEETSKRINVAGINSTSFTDTPKALKGAGPRTYNIYDITSIENDELVSCISSNTSIKLKQESHESQFYNKDDLDDSNTTSSVRSIYSTAPNPSNSPTTASSPRVSFGNTKCPSIHSYNNGNTHILSQLYTQSAIPYNTNYNYADSQYSTSTYNASMINNLDVASTFSGSGMEDNISTKPLISISDEENDEDADLDDEQKSGDNRDRHDGGIGIPVSFKDKNLDITKDGAKEEDEDRDASETSHSINTNGTAEYLRQLNTNTHNFKHIKKVKVRDPKMREKHKFQEEEQDGGQGDEDGNGDDDDDSSFEIRSKYPNSSRSTAITSLSIATSPFLTTINSNNTNYTNNAAAASIMTLASSSRHV